MSENKEKFSFNLKEIDIDSLKKGLYVSDKDVAFIGGSLIEGIGNRFSDLDIFIITENFKELNNEVLDYNFENVKYQFTQANKIGCDIEYWPKSVVDSVIEQIKNIDLRNVNIRTMNQIRIPGYDFSRILSLIHRMINGVCISNNELYKKYLDELDLRKYYVVLIRYYMGSAEGKYDDIIGNLEVKNYSTALYVAREYLVYLAMSLVSAYSISIDRKKWVFKKLEKLVEQNPELSSIVDKINKHSISIVEDDPQDDIEDIVELCEDIYDLIIDKMGEI